MKIVYKHEFEAQALEREDQICLERAIIEKFPDRVCRRVLFVSVPQISEDVFEHENARAGRYPCFPPYGLGILTRILENAGFTADILDLHYLVLESACTASSPEQFDIKAWKAALVGKVEEFQPDLVGLSCMFNLGHSWLRNVAMFLRERFPGLPIAAGGVHPTLTTEQLLEDVPAVDFVFLYEADKAFPDFLRFVNGETNGACLSQVACRFGGKTLKLTKRNLPETLEYSPDYKTLQIPRYSQIGKIGAYTFLRPPSVIAATVLSARGCRAQCGFCSVRSVNGVGVRLRDVRAVVDEVERLVEYYGVRHIMWLDDDLFYDRERAVSLFSTLAERHLGITWDASNGIIAAALTAELVKACVASGCVGFNIGIESGNPEMLRMMKKPGTVDTFRKAATLLRAAPEIFTKGFLVIGFPGETVAMLRDTVNLSLEMGLDWYPIQVLTPMPGTPIFKMMQDQGLLGDIPTTTLGKARTFSVGATGGIQKRERSEKKAARPFHNLLEGDPSRIPAREEMEDCWFTIDYRINYECILEMMDRQRIEKKAAMLKEICQRMTTDNALGTLFLGIILNKLGRTGEAREMALSARRFLDESEFWQLRFSTLQIEQHLISLEQAVCG